MAARLLNITVGTPVDIGYGAGVSDTLSFSVPLPVGASRKPSDVLHVILAVMANTGDAFVPAFDAVAGWDWYNSESPAGSSDCRVQYMRAVASDVDPAPDGSGHLNYSFGGVVNGITHAPMAGIMIRSGDVTDGYYDGVMTPYTTTPHSQPAGHDGVLIAAAAAVWPSEPAGTTTWFDSDGIEIDQTHTVSSTPQGLGVVLASRPYTGPDSFQLTETTWEPSPLFVHPGDSSHWGHFWLETGEVLAPPPGLVRLPNQAHVAEVRAGATLRPSSRVAG